MENEIKDQSDNIQEEAQEETLTKESGLQEEVAIDQASAPSGQKTSALKYVAVLLAVLFVFISLVGVIGFDVWRVLFNPSVVKQVLTEEVTDSDIIPAVLARFSEQRAQERIEKGEALSGVTEPDIVLLISYIDKDGWREIKDLLFTDEFLTHLVSVSVDGVYSWIDSDDPLPEVVWDMTPLKQSVQGDQGEQAILVAYSAMPECTEEEINDFTARLADMPPGVEVLYNLCQFPDPWYDDQVGDYVNALAVFNQNIPAKYNFSQMLAENSESGKTNPEVLKQQLRNIRGLAQWGWVAALILLLLIIAFAVRSLRDLGKFVGIPLFASGLLVLLVNFVVRASLSNLFRGAFLAQTSSFLRQEVEQSLMHLMGKIFQPMLLQGVVLLIVGIVLIVLMIIKGRGDKVAAEE